MFDLDYFCKNPQDLKSQVYYLVLETGAPTISAYSEKKPRALFEKSEAGRNEFLFFLDKLLEEGLLSEEDYYFLKCMFFEQGSFVLNFTKSAIM